MAIVNLDVTCRTCETTKVLRVNADQLAAWKSGLLIQRAFPKMSLANRELLMSKTCEACWKKLFS